MPAINRLLLLLAAAAAIGCGGDSSAAPAAKNPARMTNDEVAKTIEDENARTEERIKALEKKYGKDHPIVKEERGNIGTTK
jgi:ABC-type glycerol-3-phosphate transport system substrate-binding protein